MGVVTGLDIIKERSKWAQPMSGNVGYLAHAASVDRNLTHGLYIIKSLFGDRFKKIFSPQHGLVGDVQDNMIETDHYHHPYFELPIYSLYSETRKPTLEMLQGLQHVIVDLQDVGTRIYTYIYTMTYMMEACRELGIQVVVLDRPNPINGVNLEGNMLDLEFKSFVGRHPLPVRHGMTIGEIAIMAQKQWGIDCDLVVIPMEGWKRDMYFEDTGLPWVMPSPNLATPEAAVTFPGTVLFEGTNLSEGRGTTHSLEMIGHPQIEPYGLLEELNDIFDSCQLDGFVLRPVNFLPTFQKHQDVSCGGYQIHTTDRDKFKPWKVGQMLCHSLYRLLGDAFAWKDPPYEYEYEKWPIDMINGTDQLRIWVEQQGSYDQLMKLERDNWGDFQQKRSQALLYVE